MNRALRLACAALISLPAWCQQLEIARPVRPWSFIDAIGTRAAVWGNEDGTVEGWVFPLKLFRDLRLEIRSGGTVLPADSLARRVMSRPGSWSVIYAGDDFRIVETFVVPRDEPGALIRVEVDTRKPVEVRARFVRDFQLMWPASIGTGYSEWNATDHAFRFGADGTSYAALLGSPDASLIARDYVSNYSSSQLNAMSLGEMNGHAERRIVFAGSMKSMDEARRVYDRILAQAPTLEAQTTNLYRQYLDRTVRVEIPDANLQSAYDWSLLSVYKGLVDNPFLGEGLVAGYGPSRGIYRPGFGWFFGRDSFWSCMALTAAGDFDTARAAIRFIAKYQRADGKIPHEIAQSASLVNWFEGYPYGYASADATPLFIIAARDYTERSGDTNLARELWPRITKALDFMRATSDPAGFPANNKVGHGWVEGGPLLPIRTEYYQAGLAVEAINSASRMARWLGLADQAASLAAGAQQKQSSLERTYWRPDAAFYGFATDTEGKTQDILTVLATVPLWFDLADHQRAASMLTQLADEPFASDWGMRIISTRNPLFDPAGYHFGSVWPLFTGWASVGAYRYHFAHSGLANLQANAALALDGLGNTTEVLSGETYSPLSTASPHQIWSAAMIISPMLRGLFGLAVDSVSRSVTIELHMPANWDRASLRNVPIGDSHFDAVWDRRSGHTRLRIVNHGSRAFAVRYAPAVSPAGRITSARWRGAPVEWKWNETPPDRHAVFSLEAAPGENVLDLDAADFAYAIPFDPPELGTASRNLKLLRETWTSDGREVAIEVSGVPGHTYAIPVFGDIPVTSAAQAEYDPVAHAIKLAIPPANGPAYVHHTFRVQLAK
jgi:glycogen debranching enzyme